MAQFLTARIENKKFHDEESTDDIKIRVSFKVDSLVLLRDTFNGTANYFSILIQIGSTSEGNGFDFKRILIRRTIKSVA